MTYGQLVLNGVSDGQLSAILDVKEHHEGSLHFEPQGMRPEGVMPQPPFPPPFPPPNMVPPPPCPPGTMRPPGFPPGLPWPPGQPIPQPPPPPSIPGGQQLYDNVVLTWNNDEGLIAIKEILGRL